MATAEEVEQLRELLAHQAAQLDAVAGPRPAHSTSRSVIRNELGRHETA